MTVNHDIVTVFSDIKYTVRQQSNTAFMRANIARRRAYVTLVLAAFD